MDPRPALVALLALAAADGTSAQLPAPFSSTFEGSKRIAIIDIQAHAKVELRRSDTHAIYTVSAVVDLLSRRFDQCGVVRLEGGRIVPLEYVQLDHHKPARHVRTMFDWARGKAVTTQGDGTTRTVDITSPAWDPMSFQLALMSMAPSKRPGDQDAHIVVERGAIRTHRVTWGAAPAPDAPGPAKGFAIRSDKDSGNSVTLVLDPTHGFEPTRIGIQDVVMDRSARHAAPAALPAGHVPTCPSAAPR